MPMLRSVALPLLLCPLPALAQFAEPSGGPRLAFTLGVGVAAVPDYFGSDEAAPGLDLSLRAPFLSFGGLQVGSEDPNSRAQGLRFRGSFRYIPERSAEDHEELEGLPE